MNGIEAVQSQSAVGPLGATGEFQVVQRGPHERIHGIIGGEFQGGRNHTLGRGLAPVSYKVKQFPDMGWLKDLF